jgi:hypothetical protein
VVIAAIVRSDFELRASRLFTASYFGAWHSKSRGILNGAEQLCFSSLSEAGQREGQEYEEREDRLKRAHVL